MNATTMITVSGARVDVLNPKPQDFRIEDIAHSLSQLCRYTGHTNRFYSVAEHSLNISYMVDPWRKYPERSLWALLHDAHEAYIGDISTPVKAALGTVVRDMECRIDEALWQWLDWTPPTQVRGIVKLYDRAIVKHEWRALMPDVGIFSNLDDDTPVLVPMGSSHQVAKAFIDEFHRLRGLVIGKTTDSERPSNIRVRGSTDPCIVDSVPPPMPK